MFNSGLWFFCLTCDHLFDEVGEFLGLADLAWVLVTVSARRSLATSAACMEHDAEALVVVRGDWVGCVVSADVLCYAKTLWCSPSWVDIWVRDFGCVLALWYDAGGTRTLLRGLLWGYGSSLIVSVVVDAVVSVGEIHFIQDPVWCILRREPRGKADIEGVAVNFGADIIEATGKLSEVYARIDWTWPQSYRKDWVSRSTR